MWSARLVVPAGEIAPVEQALELIADAVTVFDADPTIRRSAMSEQPQSWLNDIWLADSAVVEAFFEEEPDQKRLQTALGRHA
ncbi:MAG: hypothetical protein MI861_10055, partial [Pirellulales bacterium]|nr:hypothetical protein [Pirellulales bacterium]